MDGTVGIITLFAVGLLISVLGVINMTGNISTLHEYHRSRVTEENVKPFGRLVGLGTLIIGVSVIVFGVLFAIHEAVGGAALVIVGTALLAVGIIAGMTVSFLAMKKYNGGIF